MTMNNAEWLLKQGIKFDDVYLTAPANYTYVIEDKTGRKLGSVDNSYSEISAFQKWLDAEHVEPILDEVEKRYLKGVIRPFKNRVRHIKKVRFISDESEYQYIIIVLRDVSYNIALPIFKEGTMYKGMEQDKMYSLDELGL